MLIDAPFAIAASYRLGPLTYALDVQKTVPAKSSESLNPKKAPVTSFKALYILSDALGRLWGDNPLESNPDAFGTHPGETFVPKPCLRPKIVFKSYWLDLCPEHEAVWCDPIHIEVAA